MKKEILELMNLQLESAYNSLECLDMFEEVWASNETKYNKYKAYIKFMDFSNYYDDFDDSEIYEDITLYSTLFDSLQEFHTSKSKDIKNLYSLNKLDDEVYNIFKKFYKENEEEAISNIKEVRSW